MPKAKPSQVIVHRIELQQSERDAMEAALAGRFVTNAVGSLGSVLSGVGAFLTPFSGAIAAIATAMIAEKGLTAIIEEAKEHGEKTKEKLEEVSQEEGSKYIAYFSSWLSAKFESGGWDLVCGSVHHYAKDYSNPNFAGRALMGPRWFFDECMRFLRTICNPENKQARNENPTELWDKWYSVEQYGKDAYYHAQQAYKKTNPFLNLIW